MKWQLGILAICVTCVWTMSHEDVMKLLKAYYNELTIVTVDPLMNCVEDSIGDTWLIAAQSFELIDDWADPVQVLGGLVSLLRPAMDSLSLVLPCSQEEVQRVFAEVKRLVNNNKALVEKILINLDVLSPGMQDLLAAWKHAQYENIGKLGGALMRWMFLT